MYITECFIINCYLTMWLLKYLSFSVLKLTVCRRSGRNGLDQQVVRLGWIGSWKLDTQSHRQPWV